MVVSMELLQYVIYVTTPLSYGSSGSTKEKTILKKTLLLFLETGTLEVDQSQHFNDVFQR